MERTPLRIPAGRDHIAQTGNAAILQNYRFRENQGSRIKCQRPRRHPLAAIVTVDDAGAAYGIVKPF